jgi:hypothetical protein
MCEHWFPVIVPETGERIGVRVNPESACWMAPILRAHGLEIEMPAEAGERDGTAEGQPQIAQIAQNREGGLADSQMAVDPRGAGDAVGCCDLHRGMVRHELDRSCCRRPGAGRGLGALRKQRSSGGDPRAGGRHEGETETDGPSICR